MIHQSIKSAPATHYYTYAECKAMAAVTAGRGERIRCTEREMADALFACFGEREPAEVVRARREAEGAGVSL